MAQRNTIQRELVLSAVNELKCHATADEVYAFISKSHPTIGRGTDYRDLNGLAKEGLITKIEVPGGPDRYDHLTSQHYHLKCNICGKIFDVDMDPIPGLIERIKNAHGMVFEDYSITFNGICKECETKINK